MRSSRALPKADPSLDFIENEIERAVKVSHPSAMTRQTVPLERLSFFVCVVRKPE
jgi:hypothetical protein